MVKKRRENNNSKIPDINLITNPTGISARKHAAWSMAGTAVKAPVRW